MKALGAGALILAAATMLSGCVTGAPSFSMLKPDSGLVTVQDVRDHVFCELKHSSLGQNELVTVALLLQVDDTADATPGVTYTQTLHGFSSATQPTLASTLGVDLGSARKRTFTTTYQLDAKEIAADAVPPGTSCDVKKDGFYLRGDLGLAEIVADGQQTIRQPDVTSNPTTPPRPPQPDPLYDKKQVVPTYASQVQFVLTRQITSLGPTWTFRYVKWPFLVNGKRLDTNSVTVTFARHDDATHMPAVDAAKHLVDLAVANAARLDDVRKQAQAEVDSLKRQELALTAQLSAIPPAPHAAAQAQQRARLEAQLQDLRRNLPAATLFALQTQASVAAARNELDLAQARAAEVARTAAADSLAASAQAGRDQLTNTLLQNLQGLHP